MRFKANGNKAKFKMKTMNMNGKNDNKKMKNKNGIDDKYGNEKKVLACVVHPVKPYIFPIDGGTPLNLTGIHKLLRQLLIN